MGALVEATSGIDSLPPSSLRLALTEHLVQFLYCLSPAYLSGDEIQELPERWQEWVRLFSENELDRDVLTAWLERTPDHPAANWSRALLNSGALGDADEPPPKIFAVALPLGGKFSAVAESVLSALLSQFYAEPDTQQLRLHILDTDEMDVREILERTRSLGAEVLIGPLLRARARTLVQLYGRGKYPFKLLLLNRPDRRISLPQRAYAYAPSAAREGEQISAHLRHLGVRHPLVLLGRQGWARAQLSVLRDEWGDALRVSPALENNAALTRQVAEALGTRESQQRHRSVQSLLGGRLEFEPRRRQDVDVVVLLLSSDIGRRIVPTLAYNFAADLPVLAASAVLRHSDQEREGDLYGIRTLALPIAVEGIAAANPDWSDAPIDFDDQGWGFTALGIDAWRLARGLHPGRVLRGASGLLRIAADGRVRGHNVWVRYYAGRLSLDHPIWHYPILKGARPENGAHRTTAP
ncbi:MAG: penicillin-binding protein activator [Gammaproteobacteria bacterium AqS3]|nr:penicillin-binding protein activator [Gammaproteobacteria bacterium AqS3]